MARGTYIYPPRPSMRLVTDTFSYCAEHLPDWNTISISGYHIREAGSTAVQEIAFTLANGIAYVEAALAAGLDVDAFAPRPQLLLERPQQPVRGGGQVPGRPADVGQDHDRALRGQGREVHAAAVPHPDRAARPSPPSSPRTTSCGSPSRPWPRCWAGPRASTPTASTRRSGCPPSGRPRSPCAPSRSSATSRASPTPSTRWPARTSSSRSPTRSSSGAWEYLERIDAMGGAVDAIEARYMQQEIEQAAYAYAKAVDDGEKIVVGVNKFVDEELEPTEVFPIDPELAAVPGGPGQAGPRASGTSRRSTPPWPTWRRRPEGTQNLLVPMKVALAAHGDPRRGVRCPARRLRGVPPDRLGRTGRSAVQPASRRWRTPLRQSGVDHRPGHGQGAVEHGRVGRRRHAGRRELRLVVDRAARRRCRPGGGWSARPATRWPCRWRGWVGRSLVVERRSVRPSASALTPVDGRAGRVALHVGVGRSQVARCSSDVPVARAPASKHAMTRGSRTVEPLERRRAGT